MPTKEPTKQEKILIKVARALNKKPDATPIVLFTENIGKFQKVSVAYLEDINATELAHIASMLLKMSIEKLPNEATPAVADILTKHLKQAIAWIPIEHGDPLAAEEPEPGAKAH